jgi:hypothetical protein
MGFRTGNKPYQVTVPSTKRPLSGRVDAAAVEGLHMTYESDTVPEDARKLIPATGRRGALLERTVLSENDFQAGFLSDNVFGKTLKTPLAVGDTVSARYAERAEFEGSAHLTGITTATPVNSPLALDAGKLKLWTGAGDGEIVAYLRRFLTKKVAANACRIEVEYV